MNIQTKSFNEIYLKYSRPIMRKSLQKVLYKEKSVKLHYFQPFLQTCGFIGIKVKDMSVGINIH